jgi:hypothetical protein
VTRNIQFAILLTIGVLARAQNILNNGGFEYGLMCFQKYSWTNDYTHQLSPDSHSGNRSYEIACTGPGCPSATFCFEPGCLKAAAWSNKIPTVPNQDYVLKVYAKCNPGTEARVYIEGLVFQKLNCTGDWAENTMSFRTLPTSNEFYFYLFIYGKGWVRFDDVALTYADGTVAGGSIHNGSRTVSVSQNAVLVDGAPYLALGFFDVNYNDIPQVVSLGANTTVGLGSNPSGVCFNTTQKHLLDRAYEFGLNVVPDSTYSAQMRDPSIFPGILQKFGPHKANIAWLLADEPDQAFLPETYIDPAIFLAQSKAAKTQTKLPVFADFQRSWSVASEVLPYVPAVDFFMGEPYGADFQGVTQSTNLFKTLNPSLPIWLAQDDPDATLIVPKAYWAVIKGATGIIYFTWDTFKADAAKLSASQQVFYELRQLKQVLFAQNIDVQITAPSSIGFTARSNGGSAYILAANPSSQSTPATFQMSTLKAGQQIQVMFENRTITANNGSFTDTFAGISRHVYVFSYAPVTLAGNIVSKTGPDAARDWTLQIVNPGAAVARTVAVSNFTFTQTAGKVCTPTPSTGLPLNLGDIAPSASASPHLLFNFTGCDTTSKFNVNIGFTSNGLAAGSVQRNNERK